MPKLSDLLWDYVPDKQAFQGMGNDLLAAANRGGVAAVLGAPVDIANQIANLGRALYGYAGNKAGLLSADQMPQLEDKPIGGSEWIGQKMQDAGMINNNRNALAELLSGMVMPGAMLKGGVKANQAMDAAIANAQRPNTLNTPGYKGQRGATVWHGSPHDIQPKPGGKYPEFDMSKIGTGEGAQAYGHGLYTAEARGVGAEYQDRLSRGLPSEIISNGRRLTFGDAATEAFGKSASDALIASGAHMKPDAWVMVSDALRAKGIKDATPTHGYLYKVDIPDEAIPRMLDWDKPLSQQSPEVQAILRKADLIDESVWPHYTGESLYQGEMNARGPYKPNGFADNAAAPPISELLRTQGIPGIRYLDGGSRSAGQGTSNYVLFDDKLGRILEKNGVPTGQTPWTPEEWAAYLSGGGK